MRSILATAALVLLLAGCAGEPEPPPPEPPPPPVTRYETRPPPEAPPERELCPVLSALLAGETNGFAELRGPALEGEVWQAREVLPGTRSCTIEGDGWPRARYLCSGAPIGSDRGLAESAFARIEQEIDACLARASWFPRDWQKGKAFTFAMGERQVSWTDPTTEPPSVVTLKLQQDLVSRDYHVRLNLGAAP